MNTSTLAASSSTRSADGTQHKSDILSAEQQMKAALARIEASRSALIVCLSPEPQERHDAASGETGGGSAKQSFSQTLAARIGRDGLVQGSWRTLRALARRWWTRQPWHSAVELMGQTVAHQARPLMRRHPMATLAVGAAVGAGLVAVTSAMRPWAWHQIRGKDYAWGNRVGGLLWTQISSAPVQMALAGALAAWLAELGSRKAPPTGPAGPALHPARSDGSPSGTTASAP